MEILASSPRRCQDLSQHPHHVGKQYSRLRVSTLNLAVQAYRLTRDFRLNLSLPLVITELGYTARIAQLLTIPVYVGALLCVLACAILADRYGIRRPFIVYP